MNWRALKLERAKAYEAGALDMRERAAKVAESARFVCSRRDRIRLGALIGALPPGEPQPAQPAARTGEYCETHTRYPKLRHVPCNSTPSCPSWAPAPPESWELED